jgi:hypothetical protein
MPATLGGNLCARFERRLEIVSAFDELHPQGSHGCILRLTVAMGNDNRSGYSHPGSRKPNRLTVIAAGGGDHASQIRFRSTQAIEVDHPATDLERSDRRVVLVFDPDRTPTPLVEKRPALLRRRRHGRIDDLRGLLEICQLDHQLPASSNQQSFSIEHSAFSIQHSAFSIQHSAFSIQHSAFHRLP